jgi:hypothetical protein
MRGRRNYRRAANNHNKQTPDMNVGIYRENKRLIDTFSWTSMPASSIMGDENDDETGHPALLSRRTSAASTTNKFPLRRNDVDVYSYYNDKEVRSKKVGGSRPVEACWAMVFCIACIVPALIALVIYNGLQTGTSTFANDGLF